MGESQEEQTNRMGTAEEVLVGVLIEIFKESVAVAKRLGKTLAVRANALDLLGTAAAEYASRAKDRYDSVRVFGMREPRALTSIYVPARVRSQIAARSAVSLDQIQERLSSRASVGGDAENGVDIVEKNRRTIILGGPGSGKSTFLKIILIRALEGAARERCLPILVSLRDIEAAQDGIRKAMIEELRVSGVPQPAEFLSEALRQGRCWVLLDAFDEARPEHLDRLVREAVTLSDEFPGNRWTITCREAAYNYWFDQFVDVEIAPFGDQQVAEFVAQWFDQEPKLSESFMRQMAQWPEAKELARTPLLLTLLCIAFSESMEVPRNKADLYKEAMEALLHRWDSSRRIERAQVYKKLSLREKEALLSELAARGFEEGKKAWRVDELHSLIASHLAATVRDGDGPEDAVGALRAIEIQHGLLVQASRGIYAFSHLAVQEYYVAKYIVSNSHGGTLEALLEQRCFDPQWREVVVLTSCMLPKADVFLTKLSERVSHRIEGMGLQETLSEIRRMYASETLLTPIITRNLALLFVLFQVYWSAGQFDLVLTAAAREPRDDAQTAIGSIASEFSVQHAQLQARVGDVMPEEIVASLSHRPDLGRHAAIGESAESARQAALAGFLRRVHVLDRKLARELDLDGYKGPSAWSLLLDFGRNLVDCMKAHAVVYECIAAGCYVSNDYRRSLLASPLPNAIAKLKGGMPNG